MAKSKIIQEMSNVSDSGIEDFVFNTFNLQGYEPVLSILDYIKSKDCPLPESRKKIIDKAIADLRFVA